jgi:DNA replication protein DnaC
VKRSAPESSDASTAESAARPDLTALAGAAALDEAVCPECGGGGFVRLRRPFGHPEFGKAVPCRCVVQESEEHRFDRLLRYSSLGPLSRLSFANLAPNGRSANPRDRELFRQLTADAQAFAEAPEGWLLIHGPSGAGKTHVAAAIANRCLERGHAALFTVVPDLLDHLRSSYSGGSLAYEALLDQVREAPVLVLDDLGTQTGTEWANEKLYQVLNHRYNARLATVVTTNQTPDRLDERLRMRLTDPDLARVYSVEAGSAVDLDALDASGLQRLREMTFESFDTRLLHLDNEARVNVERAYWAAMRFADEPENWLVLEGDHGCGKTHLAAAIANRRRSLGERPLFLVVPDLLDYLRYAMERENRTSFYEVFDGVRKAPLLVLDDFGSQSDSGWVRDHLFQLLNYRYMSRLPTVFTIDLETLARLESRLLSRIYDPQISAEVPIKAPPYSVDLDLGAGAPARPRAAGRPAAGGARPRTQAASRHRPTR